MKRLRKLSFIIVIVLLCTTMNGVPGKFVKAAAPSVEYQPHVQSEGWKAYVSNGATGGTTGKAHALEAIKIQIKGVSGGIAYQTHLKNIGWTSWVSNNQQSGTTGQSRPIEAIRIKLTGNIANTYNVYYRVHVGDFGWLGWTKNGNIAGSTGCSLRMEAIQIKLCAKNKGMTTSTAYITKPALTTQAHVGGVGWQKAVSENAISGTVGQGRRMEAMIIKCSDFLGGSGIQYRSHVQNIGWQNWCNSGGISGTTGRSLQMEAVQIKLTGRISAVYDVYYRVHVGDMGWLGWAQNGESAGTSGGSRRMEAIQIKLVRKGESVDRGGSAYYNITSTEDGSSWDKLLGKTVANINSTYYTSGNLSYRSGYKGQCTWYAYGRFYEVNKIALKTALHAKYWLSANDNDSRVSVLYGASNIRSKAIAVRTTGNYGHVMFVEYVSYSGGKPQYVYYTECNTDNNGRYDAGKDCILKKKTYSRFIKENNPAGYIVAK